MKIANLKKNMQFRNWMKKIEKEDKRDDWNVGN